MTFFLETMVLFNTHSSLHTRSKKLKQPTNLQTNTYKRLKIRDIGILFDLFKDSSFFFYKNESDRRLFFLYIDNILGKINSRDLYPFFLVFFFFLIFCTFHVFPKQKPLIFAFFLLYFKTILAEDLHTTLLKPCFLQFPHKI